MMHSLQGRLSTRKGKLKVGMCPCWGSDPSRVLGPNSGCWGRFPHCWCGVSTWTHLTNGEGHCPPLCGPNIEHEAGAVPRLCWHNLPKEKKGVEKDKDSLPPLWY